MNFPASDPDGVRPVRDDAIYVFAAEGSKLPVTEWWEDPQVRALKMPLKDIPQNIKDEAKERVAEARRKELKEAHEEQLRRETKKKFGDPDSGDESWPNPSTAGSDEAGSHFSWEKVMAETAHEGWVKKLRDKDEPREPKQWKDKLPFYIEEHRKRL